MLGLSESVVEEEGREKREERGRIETISFTAVVPAAEVEDLTARAVTR